MAQAVGLPPQDLLHGRADRDEPRRRAGLLAALLQRDGTTAIAELERRMGCTQDELLDGVDEFNRAACGLRIMRWDDELGLAADPALDLHPTRSSGEISDEIETDRVLWQVIDCVLPTPLPKHITDRLHVMVRHGLVCVFDDEWRPSDAVVRSLDLIAWDTLELIKHARATTASTTTAIADP